MPKILASLIVAATAIAAPALSFAQSYDSLTRAEVRAALVRVEQAGYDPALADDDDYPADIQGAEAKIAAQDGQQASTQDVGGAAQDGRNSSGAPARMPTPSSCLGPISFCNVFFGR